jgi:hypothetical protein
MDKEQAIKNFWRAYGLIQSVAVTGEGAAQGTIGHVDALLRFDGDQDALITQLSLAIERLKKAIGLLEIVRYDVTVERSLASQGAADDD